jgi:TRAP-type C4-dicarboxylate transport system substrate-binding protein
MKRTLLSGFAVIAAMTLTAAGAGAQDNKLIMTSLSPVGSPNSIFFAAWVQKVNDQAKGAVAVDLRDGIALATFGNTYDRVQNDVIQIGWAQHGLVAGKFPLSEVAGLPFLVDDIGAGAAAQWRLYKSGLLDSEYGESVPLWYGLLGLQGLHFSKQSHSLDDLAGAKLRINGRVVGQLVERMGGTPISMQSEDMYAALQRGTIDGIVSSWAAFEPYKLQEVTALHYEVAFGTTSSMFFMAKKKYDALPAAGRQAIDANTGEAMTRAFMVHIAAQADRARAPVAASSTHKIVQPTAAQIAAWQAKAMPVFDQWAKERAGGEKILAEFRRLYAAAKSGG